MPTWNRHLAPGFVARPYRPPADSERNAARIFGADWTFYVLGGSSSSNQIVGHGVIGNDDIVLVDANCHKSIGHVLTVTSALPCTSNLRAMAMGLSDWCRCGGSRLSLFSI